MTAPAEATDGPFHLGHGNADHHDGEHRQGEHGHGEHGHGEHGHGEHGHGERSPLGSGPTPAHVAVARTMAVDVMTAEVTTALRRAGVASILLKGPAVARWLYDDGAMRPYVDADLLVAPDRFDAAEAVLAELGFVRPGLETIPGDWPRPARTWLRSHHENVDLHRTFSGVGVDAATLWEALSRRIEPMDVLGTDVDVLQPPARALFVALHAAKDGVRVAKTVHDVGHAVDRLPDSTWEEAAVLAAELRATPALTAGLRRTDAGAALAERLGLGSSRTLMVSLRERGAPPLAVGFDWLVTAPGVRGKASLVVRKLVPPPAYLREWKPVASKGRSGLAVAYVWRPLWVLWHAGPAVLAWTRARRESSS